mgnify:CR=1 FL=1
MINFELELEGLARKLFEVSEETLIKDGIKAAANQAKSEIAENFSAGGRPNAWPPTKDGRVPLQGPTGRLKQACSADANVKQLTEGFELSPASDQEEIADVQDRRYNIFVLPEEGQKNVAEAFERGILEG